MNINGMEYLDTDSVVEEEREKEHDRLVQEREDKLRSDGYNQAIKDVLAEIEMYGKYIDKNLNELKEAISSMGYLPKGKE